MSTVEKQYLLSAFWTVARACVLVIASIFTMAALFLWLWNAVPAVLFKLPAIGYWQAVGLLLLFKLMATASVGMRVSLKSGESE